MAGRRTSPGIPLMATAKGLAFLCGQGAMQICMVGTLCVALRSGYAGLLSERWPPYSEPERSLTLLEIH